MLREKLNAGNVKDLIGISYGNKPVDKDRFKVQKKYSNQNRKVVKDKETGQRNVVFRGTKSLSDIGNDAMIAIGQEKHTTRFKNSKNIVNKLNKKYGKKNVNVLGDSLGGAIAEASASKNQKIITTNKASGIN